MMMKEGIEKFYLIQAQALRVTLITCLTGCLVVGLGGCTTSEKVLPSPKASVGVSPLSFERRGGLVESPTRFSDRLARSGSQITLGDGKGGVLPKAQIPLLWSKRMAGAIADISVSKKGNAISVLTHPDLDIEGSARQHLLFRFDEKGRLSWKKVLRFPIKDQDISDDGSLLVVSNYENEISGMDDHGKVLWTTEGTCKPYVLSSSHRILCYHDDDSEPRVAFDVFNWKGEKTFSFPISQDILALKYSEDEKNIVLALTGGQLILLDSNFHSVWQKKVEGEVIDLAVSSSPEPKIAALLRGEGKSRIQKVVVLDPTGKSLGTFSPSFRSIQIEFSPRSDSIFYYGNDGEGQFMGNASLAQLQEAWKRGDSHYSDYSSSILIFPDTALMGFEQVTPQSRTSHLLAFDFAGQMKWDLPLPSDEGAYLYTHRLAASTSLLVIGTDDARLSAYRLK